MPLVERSLLTCCLLDAQLLTVDTSGNITATGTYSSGLGSAGPGKITLNGTTSGSVGIRVDTTPLTYNWLIPNSTSPTNGQFLTFGTPVSGDVPISYRTIVSGDLPVNLTDSAGSGLLPNPTFNRVTAGGLTAGDTALYACPTGVTRYCMIMASTFFKAGTGSATALLEYKAGGAGSYIPFRSVSVNASGATQDSGEAFILTPGDILGVNLSSGATSTNIWVSEVEFDETAALVPVRVTSGFVSGNNTLYMVPTGKSALVLSAGLSGPGLSNSIVRYFNNTGAATNVYLYLVPSGGSAGTTNQISPTTNSVGNQTLGLIQTNTTLSAGDSIVANVNSTSSSQIFYLNLLVF